MNNKRIISLKLYWILVIVSGLCVVSFGNIESEINTEAEQQIEKANELRKLAVYDAAITEFETVISLSPNSEIAQDAQYWIGQLYFQTGQFDAALTAFQKLIDEYPASTIIPATILSIERVQQAKNNESFIEAVRDGDIGQVKLLISQGVDVNVKNSSGETPLHMAASNGHFEIVKALLDSEANVNITIPNPGRPNPFTPLYLAVEQDHKDIAELLVDNGAKYYVDDTSYYPALREAAVNGYKDMVELFLSKVVDTSSIHMAACAGDLSKVQEFIEQGTEADTEDEDGLTALMWAVCSGQTEVAEFLIDNGADINAKSNIDDRTPLCWACRADNKEFAELLIDKGADVNSKDNEGRTPLYWVCQYGYKEIAELLIDKGADVNVENSTNMAVTPLHRACQCSKEFAELLIDNGADINAKNFAGWTPLHHTIIYGPNEVAELLIDEGADVNAKNNANRTALDLAIRTGQKDKVELLINKGADINATDNRGITPLILAGRGGHTEIVELLREHGAEESEVGAAPRGVMRGGVRRGMRRGGVGAELASSPLHEAAAAGDIERVKLLISQGEDVNAKNDSDETPLHNAVGGGLRGGRGGFEGPIEMVLLLVENGADINAKNSRGMTPLYIAASNGRKDIVELLINKGADVDARLSIGVTPLHIAVNYGHRDVVEILLENGADVNAQDNLGGTPLLFAARRGQKEIEMVELLINKGADVNISNNAGITPLDIAQQQENAEIVELLREHGAEE